MAQSDGWRAAPPSFLRWLRTSWISLSPVRSFLCHSHRMDNLCFHHRDIGILFSFLPLLSFAFSPICLVLGIIVFVPDTFLAMNASFSSRTQNVSSSLFDMNPSSPSSSSTQKPSSPSYSPCSMMKNVLLRLPP